MISVICKYALYAECHYGECHLCLMSFMISVTNKQFMLSVIMLIVIMLNVVALHFINDVLKNVIFHGIYYQNSGKSSLYIFHKQNAFFTIRHMVREGQCYKTFFNRNS